jgi:hypothetical protein
MADDDLQPSDPIPYLESRGLFPGAPAAAQTPATAQPPPPPSAPPQQLQPGQPAPIDIKKYPYQHEVMPPPLQQINPAQFRAPGPQYDPPMKAFQDPMVVLATLGSLFTRRPLTTALNAGAKAMEGYHQGQKDVYQQNREQFEENVKIAMEQNRVELAKYKDAWDRRREMNWDQVAPKMYEEAAARGDTLMTQALNSHNWELVEKVLAGREQAQERFEQLVAMQDIRYGITGPRREMAASIYKGIKDGTTPPTLTGLGPGVKPAVQAMAADDGFDLTRATLDYASALKQVQSLSGAQMVRYVGLTRSVLKTIDEVKDLAGKMQQSGIYYYNQFELAKLIKTEGNSERGRLATRYLEAVGFLKEEVANLAQGGYAPTEPAWTLASQQVNENYGASQIDDSLSEMQRLLNYRFKQIPNIESIGPGAPNPYLPSRPAVGAGEQPPEKGERRQFKQGWGVWNGEKWVPENAQ